MEGNGSVTFMTRTSDRPRESGSPRRAGLAERPVDRLEEVVERVRTGELGKREARALL